MSIIFYCHCFIWYNLQWFIGCHIKEKKNMQSCLFEGFYCYNFPEIKVCYELFLSWLVSFSLFIEHFFEILMGKILWFKDPYFPLCFYRMQKSLSLRSTSASLEGFWLHTTSPDRRYIITSYWFLCVSSLSVLFHSVVILYDGIVYRPPHRWSSGQRVHVGSENYEQLFQGK